MAKQALVTGSGGLVGKAMVELLIKEGFEVVGIDNDRRAYFFGQEASTNGEILELCKIKEYAHYSRDIRDADAMDEIFRTHGPFDFICHAAAQPAHDWSIDHTREDFAINGMGTLNVLEAYRQYSPKAIFIHVSTSKVYGDNVNELPFIELDTRYDLKPEHYYYKGINESMNIQNCKHSPFGASKTSGDIMAQEFGRYFNLPITIFRPVCISGPSHKGAKLHGYLSYLVKCIATGEKYTVNGYKGKQVRDNIHAKDLVRAFYQCYLDETITRKYPGMYYNIGGGRKSNNSILEAIADIERILGRKGNIEISDEARRGDHQWCIFSNKWFQRHHPDWDIEYDNERLLHDLCIPYL